MKTQNKKILQYLKGGKTINAIQALNFFGSFRLSARIHDLRDQGHNIESIRHRRDKKNFCDYKLINK